MLFAGGVWCVKFCGVQNVLLSHAVCVSTAWMWRERRGVFWGIFENAAKNLVQIIIKQSPVVASLTGRNFTGKPLLLLPVSKSFEMLTFECNYRICPNLNISWKLPVLQKNRVTCEDCGQSLRDKYVLKKHVSTFQLICFSWFSTGISMLSGSVCKKTNLFWVLFHYSKWSQIPVFQIWICMDPHNFG